MEDYICLQLEESRIEFREEMRELQRHTKSQFGDIKSQFVEINGKLDEIIKLMPNWLRNNEIESPDLIVISSDQEIPNPVDDLLNNEPLDSVESGEKVVASQQSWIEHDVERAKNDVAIYEENCALNFVDVAACNERSATDLQKVENFTSATPIAGISASSTYSIGFEEAIDGRKNGTEGDACSQVCIAFDKLSKASQTALSDEHYAHCVFDEYPQPFIVEHSDRNGGSVDKRGVVLPIMDLLSVLNLTDETTMNGSMWLNELLMLIFDPGGSRPHRGCDLLGEHGDFHFSTNVVYAPEYNYYAFDENSTSHSSVGVYTLGLTLGIPSTGFVRAAFHEFCEQKQAFIMLMSSQQVLLHDVDKCNAVVTVVLHLFSFSHPRDVITTSVHIFIGRKVALEEVEGAFTGESCYSVQNTDKIGTSASSIAGGNSKIYVIPAGLSIQRVPFDLAERALLPLVYTVLIEFTLLGRNNLGYQQIVTYKSSQLFDGFKPSQCRARRCSITEHLDVGLLNKIGVPFVISVVHFDEMSCVTKCHSNVFYPGTKVYVAKWTEIEVHMNLQCIGAALAGILAHPVRCRPFDPGGNLLRQMECHIDRIRLVLLFESILQGDKSQVDLLEDSACNVFDELVINPTYLKLTEEYHAIQIAATAIFEKTLSDAVGKLHVMKMGCLKFSCSLSDKSLTQFSAKQNIGSEELVKWEPSMVEFVEDAMKMLFDGTAVFMFDPGISSSHLRVCGSISSSEIPRNSILKFWIGKALFCFYPGGCSLPQIARDHFIYSREQGDYCLTTIMFHTGVKAMIHVIRIIACVCGIEGLFDRALYENRGHVNVQCIGAVLVRIRDHSVWRLSFDPGGLLHQMEGQYVISFYIIEDNDVWKRKGIGIQLALALKQDDILNGASAHYYAHTGLLTCFLVDWEIILVLNTSLKFRLRNLYSLIEILVRSVGCDSVDPNGVKQDAECWRILHFILLTDATSCAIDKLQLEELLLQKNDMLWRHVSLIDRFPWSSIVSLIQPVVCLSSEHLEDINCVVKLLNQSEHKDILTILLVEPCEVSWWLGALMLLTIYNVLYYDVLDAPVTRNSQTVEDAYGGYLNAKHRCIVILTDHIIAEVGCKLDHVVIQMAQMLQMGMTEERYMLQVLIMHFWSTDSCLKHVNAYKVSLSNKGVILSFLFYMVCCSLKTNCDRQYLGFRFGDKVPNGCPTSVFVMTLFPICASHSLWLCHSKTEKCRDIMDRLIVMITGSLVQGENEEIVDNDTYTLWIQHFLMHCSIGRQPYKFVTYGASLLFLLKQHKYNSNKALFSFAVRCGTFVWDPGVVRVCISTTLRTRRFLRGRSCHELILKIRNDTEGASVTMKYLLLAVSYVIWFSSDVIVLYMPYFIIEYPECYGLYKLVKVHC